MEFRRILLISASVFPPLVQAIGGELHEPDLSEDAVVIGGEYTLPSGPTDAGSDFSFGDFGTGDSLDGADTATAPDYIRQVGDPMQKAGPSTPGAAPAAAAPVLPTTITYADVQRFAPGTTSFTLEPSWWAIKGGHLNAYASATTQTIQGTIATIPVTITFVPAEYVWSWGDGTTLTTTTGGASWEALGLPDWSPTETSHVYESRGDVQVSLTVRYSATVTGQGRTIPVTGFVAAPATSAPVRVVESHRALVAADCLVDPHGPGC